MNMSLSSLFSVFTLFLQSPQYHTIPYHAIPCNAIQINSNVAICNNQNANADATQRKCMHVNFILGECVCMLQYDNIIKRTESNRSKSTAAAAP